MPAVDILIRRHMAADRRAPPIAVHLGHPGRTRMDPHEPDGAWPSKSHAPPDVQLAHTLYLHIWLPFGGLIGPQSQVCTTLLWPLAATSRHWRVAAKP